MKIILSVLSLFFALAIGAQNKIGDYFKTMPDSIMPLLTTNNRLDMMDFMDAKMKARIVNRLEGESEMMVLTKDSLVVKMSDVLDVTLSLVPTDISVDSSQVAICMQSRYHFSEQEEIAVCFFSTKWKPLDKALFKGLKKERSTLLKRDEKVFEASPIM